MHFCTFRGNRVDGRFDVVQAERRALRRAGADRLFLQDRQRRRAHLQGPDGWPPPDWRVLSAGEIFGLEAGEEHVFSAEAIVDTKIRIIKRSVAISLATRDSTIARQLWTLTGCELQRTQNHLLLLGKSAAERVASFLLEMAERGQSGDEMRLMMSRQDIADYLGLTIATASRMLTRFEKDAAIALPTCKRVVLRDRSVLQRLLA